MRIAYCTWGMMKTPFEEGLPAIAKIGYTGIELSVSPGWPTELYSLDRTRKERIAQLLTDYNIALAAIAGHTSVCEEDPKVHTANMQRLRETIDLADELRQDGHAPVVVSGVGGRSDDWERTKQTVAERVHELAEYGASRDVIYALEMHCGTSLDTPRRALWLLEQVNHPNVGLNFDISHCEVICIPTEESCSALAPHSVFAHVKDQRGIYPNHEFLTPGSGPTDYVQYLRAMHAAGYTGFIGVEVSVMVQGVPGYDPYVDAALAYYALKHAFNKSGVPLEE